MRARCASFPRPGETVLARSTEWVQGGKGANQAVAAARLGATVAMVGAVGSDDLADLVVGALVGAGVDVSGVARVPGATSMAMVVVDAAGENQIVVCNGANDTLATLPDAVRHADAVVVQLEVPDAALSEAARLCSGLFVLNAAPARAVPADVLARVDLLVVNEQEYADLGSPAARLVAVTLGSRGARLLEDGVEVAKAQSPAVEVRTTVGAGDTFTAALVIALLSGTDPAAALEDACATAARHVAGR